MRKFQIIFLLQCVFTIDVPNLNLNFHQTQKKELNRIQTKIPKVKKSFSRKNISKENIKG